MEALLPRDALRQVWLKLVQVKMKIRKAYDNDNEDKDIQHKTFDRIGQQEPSAQVSYKY